MVEAEGKPYGALKGLLLEHILLACQSVLTSTLRSDTLSRDMDRIERKP